MKESFFTWHRRKASSSIERAQTDEAVNHARQGRGVLLVGGIGIGKSTVLDQVDGKLQVLGIKTIRATPFTSDNSQKALRDAVFGQDSNLIDLLRPTQAEGVFQTILIDEFDRFLRSEGNRPQKTYRSLAVLEEAREELGIGVVVAVGPSFFVLRESLGSPFVSKAIRVEICPFSATEVENLANPLVSSGRLQEDELTELQTLTGGHPTLIAYALGRLDSFDHRHRKLTVLSILSSFREEEESFIQHYVRNAVPDQHRESLRAVLRLLQRDGPRIERASISKCLEREFEVPDLLRLLITTGIAEIRGPRAGHSIDIHLRSSLLVDALLSETPSAPDDIWSALERTAGRIHSMSPDYFRGAKEDRQVVPEAVFASAISLSLQASGWTVERESQSGTGRTDVKATMPSRSVTAILEVKIWPRNNASEIHKQVVSYFTAGTTHLGSVTIATTDLEIQEFVQKCTLDTSAVTRQIEPFLSCVEVVEPSVGMKIRHYVLRLARR